MYSKSDTLVMTRDEIGALMTFADKPGGKRDMVRFELRRDGGCARATDGKRAVEVVFQHDGYDAAFSVTRAALDRVKRMMVAGDRCVLELKSGSTPWVRIEHDDDEGITRVIWRTRWAGGAVDTQLDMSLGMDVVRDIIANAKSRARHIPRGSAFSLNAEYLADLQLVARAAQLTRVDIYPAEDSSAPVLFEVVDVGYMWHGVVMPMRAGEPGPQEDDDALTMPEPLELEVQESTARKARDSRAQAAKEAAAAVQAAQSEDAIVETLEPPVAPRRRGKAKPAVDPEDEAEAAVKAALKRRGAKRR